MEGRYLKTLYPSTRYCFYGTRFHDTGFNKQPDLGKVYTLGKYIHLKSICTRKVFTLGKYIPPRRWRTCRMLGHYHRDLAG